MPSGSGGAERGVDSDRTTTIKQIQAAARQRWKAGRRVEPFKSET